MKVHDPYECQYCKKKTTPANKARHMKNCSVKKAGGSDKIISIADPKTLKCKFTLSLEVKPNEVVQQIPNKKKQRMVFYISGQAGSGKSYYANKLVDKYHSMYPKNKIYLFSFLTEDVSITNKHIKRVNLESFLTTSLTLNDLKNSLIVYDDVDTIKNKALKMKLFNLQDAICQVGRHESISFIYISHLSCNGLDTKMILSECNSITIFPSTMGNRALRYLLGEYFGPPC
jgi:hypothetical protein